MAILNYVIRSKEDIRNHDDRKQNLQENMHNFVVPTASADGLAPLGAMATAGTVVTKILPYIYVVTLVTLSLLTQCPPVCVIHVQQQFNSAPVYTIVCNIWTKLNFQNQTIWPTPVIFKEITKYMNVMNENDFEQCYKSYNSWW